MPHHRLAARSKGGFTLVELGVATVVIAALVTVLVSSLAGVRASTQQQACASNLQGIGVAVSTYANDYANHIMPSISYPDPGYYQGYGTAYGLTAAPPPQPLNGWHARGDYEATGVGWQGVGWSFCWQMWLWPYAPNMKLFTDPAHASWPASNYEVTNWPTDAAGYDPVGSLDGPFWIGNYGANPYVMGNNYYMDYPMGAYPSLANIKHPSDVMMVIDNGYTYAEDYDPLVSWGVNYLPGAPAPYELEIAYAPNAVFISPNMNLWANWTAPGQTVYDPGSQTGLGYTWLGDDANLGRHPHETVNALMVDGHVAPYSARDVQLAGESNPYNAAWAPLIGLRTPVLPPGSPLTYFYGITGTDWP